MHQDCETLAREYVRERAAAVIGVAKRLHGHRRTFRSVGDLLLAEELEVAVVVAGDNAGKRPFCGHWLEQEAVCSRAETDRPR